MIALTVLPLAATGLAVLFVLPDVIPTHAGTHGIDTVGSKYDAFVVAFIVAGCGALLTVMYVFMDKLAKRYKSDAQGGRTAVTFAAVWMNVILLLGLVWMTFGLK